LGVSRLPTAWQDAVLFGVLLIFLVLRPQGLWGRPLRTVTV
jgi:branched-subunit amino acid ABC-type transport system permease component